MLYCRVLCSVFHLLLCCSYDEEAQLDFMDGKGPAVETGTPVNRVVKEVKRNWWLWGAVGFALVLITGVVMFRHKLYNTGNFGLPFLAGCALSFNVFAMLGISAFVICRNTQSSRSVCNKRCCYAFISRQV